MTTIETAQQKIRAWRKNPISFVRDNFGVEPDAWQCRVLSVFPSQKPNEMRQAMQACAGPGKSAVLAWCAWNFLACYGDVGEHPKGAAVSITADNLADNLWPELSKWQGRSEYLLAAFTWTKTRVFAKDHPETWFISARSWAKTANADEQGRVLSGLHSKYLLFLLDESGDIPPTVLKAAEQGLSSCAFGKILQAGNPTSREGILYQAAVSQRSSWHVTEITGDPDVKLRSSRIDKVWAAEQIEKYGRDDPWVQAYILGQFPAGGLNTLLSPEEVASAAGRHLPVTAYDFSQKRVGVDVARFGTDKTVMFPRQGLAAFTPIVMRGARSNEIAARLAVVKKEFASEVEMVDDTGGYGSGVIDAYLTAGLSAMSVCFAGKALNPKYFNKRSEMWFEMAEWLKRGGVIPDIPELRRELCCPTYSFHQGKFRLEEKDQIKSRLGFSPDFADALALTFAVPDQPKAMSPLEAQLAGHGKVLTDFDPFRDEVRV